MDKDQSLRIKALELAICIHTSADHRPEPPKAEEVVATAETFTKFLSPADPSP